MDKNEVSLYECLYGMELFKSYFCSETAMNDCMNNAVSKYRDFHSRGREVGIIDPQKTIINLENGDIMIGAAYPIENVEKRIDLIKFIPPEILCGDSKYGVDQDLFCLAMLLFAIRFFSHPFDGELLYKSPIVTADDAIKYYSNPEFIFDNVYKNNPISKSTDSYLIERWQNEENERLKEAFMTCFTSGIKNCDMRPGIDRWENILNGVTNPKLGDQQIEVFMLDIDGKRIKLTDSLELYEKDLFGEGSSNKKIAVVLSSKKSKNLLALGNASDDTWSVYMPDSREIMVTPKGVAPLVNGATISIGDLLVSVVSERR